MNDDIKKKDKEGDRQRWAAQKEWEAKNAESDISPAELAREKVLGFFGVEDSAAKARRAAIARQKGK